MLRYDLYSMQLLASVAETKSFAKTATLVHLTPSAVSKRIAELETRVGSRLLIRTPQGVDITDAGHAVVRASHDILDRIGAMSRDVAGTAYGEAGEITVVSNATGLQLGLIQDLKAFRGRYPQVRIKVEERISGEAIDDVESGRADIGVCAAHVPRRGLSALDYRWTRLVVAVHRDHPLASRQSVSYREVAYYPQIGRPEGSMLPGGFPVDQAAPVIPSDGLDSSARSFDAVIEFVRANVGVAVLPAISVEGRPARGVLAIPLIDDWARFPLAVYHDPTLLANPSAKLLVTWLSDAARQTADGGAAPCGTATAA
jgi:DNA-binding transcriptional LysR family regulator